MKNKSYLLKYSIEYLSKYSSSKKNLERILKSKIQRITKIKKERFDLYSEIPNILKKLEKHKFINDEDYTINKISLLVNQLKSKKFIYNYLIIKGIDKNIIHEQIKFFELGNKDWEKKSAYIFAKKKNLLDNKENYVKKLGKMARAGFPYELCMEILKND